MIFVYQKNISFYFIPIYIFSNLYGLFNFIILIWRFWGGFYKVNLKK